jgi:transposase
MKRRTKNDNLQRVLISKNGGNPSIKWNKDEFVFRSTRGTGSVKPYKKKELMGLSPKGSSDYKVTLKYERSSRYCLLIPVVIKKQSEQE